MGLLENCLGLFLFFVGIAGVLASWYKGRKKMNV